MTEAKFCNRQIAPKRLAVIEVIHQMLDSLITHIHSNKPFLSLEVTPNLGANLSSSLISELKDCTKAHAFVCTDSPLARLKPSSLLSSLKLQNALGKPVICTLSMRDRNSIALSAEILAINELGVRAFLSLTGDPIKLGDCADSKGVFESNSLKLAQIISQLNAGYALSGKPLDSAVQRIYNFSTISSYAQNPKTLESKIQKKITSGCEALFSQPVYSPESAEMLLQNIQRANASTGKSAQGKSAQLILGFFPVMSYKAALFLRDKLPGVFIPDDWVERLQKASQIGKDEEHKVGLDLSLQLFKALQKIHNKIHFMSSNNFALFKQFADI